MKVVGLLVALTNACRKDLADSVKERLNAWLGLETGTKFDSATLQQITYLVRYFELPS